MREERETEVIGRSFKCRGKESGKRRREKDRRVRERERERER